MIVLGTIFHGLLGAVFAFAAWKLPKHYAIGFLVSVGFALKELGEAKYKIAGSIKDVSKNIDMLEMVFTDPSVIVQWLVPGLVAFGVCLYLRGRDDSI